MLTMLSVECGKHDHTFYDPDFHRHYTSVTTRGFITEEWLRVLPQILYSIVHPRYEDHIQDRFDLLGLGHRQITYAHRKT